MITPPGIPSADAAASGDALAEWSVERLAALAARLVAAPSENPDPEGAFESLAVDAIEREASALGLSVVRQSVAHGRDNLLIATRGATTGPPILFLGHSDVVPAGPGWSREPFEPVIEEGRLLGRGAADMKGGIAAVLAALDVLGRDEAFPYPIELLVTVDEEDRATGIATWLEAVAPRRLLACIVAEPTDLDVIVGCRGAANLRLEITGLAAHAGRPDDGRSAIVAASRIVQHLQAQHDDWRLASGSDPWVPTWNVGRIEGGHGTSIVADHCVLDLDRRMLPHEQPDEILAELLSDLETHGIVGDGIGVRGMIDMSMPGFVADELAALPRLALAAVRGSGNPGACIRRWSAACEGGFVARHDGAPTIVLGPGEVTTQAHQPDESVSIDDLHIAAVAYKALARAIAANRHVELGDAPEVPPPHAEFEHVFAPDPRSTT